MKRFITISLVSAMFAAATPAQSSNAWMEQWNKAKTGRYSPMEEARQRAARADATNREEVAPKAVTPANTWFEDRWKAKNGRNSPAVEVSQRTEPSEPVVTKAATPANTWLEDRWRAKYGRSSP
jgi:hypothetical protein